MNTAPLLPFPPPISLDHLRNGPDKILARADLTRRRAAFIVLRTNGSIGLVVVQRDRDTGELASVLGSSSFARSGLRSLERAVAEALRALELPEPPAPVAVTPLAK